MSNETNTAAASATIEEQKRVLDELKRAAAAAAAVLKDKGKEAASEARDHKIATISGFAIGTAITLISSWTYNALTK